MNMPIPRVIAGLDPAIHQAGWTRGASPRVTAIIDLK
jgi:hypothetical protein